MSKVTLFRGVVGELIVHTKYYLAHKRHYVMIHSPNSVFPQLTVTLSPTVAPFLHVYMCLTSSARPNIEIRDSDFEIKAYTKHRNSKFQNVFNTSFPALCIATPYPLLRNYHRSQLSRTQVKDQKTTNKKSVQSIYGNSQILFVEVLRPLLTTYSFFLIHNSN